MGILYDAIHNEDKYKELKNEFANIAFDYATRPDLQIRNQNDEVKQALLDDAIDIGEIREPDSGFWGELKDGFLLSSNRAMRGIANTFGSEDTVKYFDEVLADNPRWIAPEERGTLGSIGGAIGGGIGSTAVTLPGMIAGGVVGTTVGGPVGTVAGFMLPFLNTFAISFGDTVDRNIQNGLSGYGAVGAAVLESSALAAVETVLGTVPVLGKMFKGMPTSGLAAKVLSKIQSKLGKKAANSFMLKLGKNILGNSFEEGTEEAIQYLIETAGDAITESIGKDQDFFDTFGNKISAKEWWNNTWQGAVAGFGLGALPGTVDAMKHPHTYSDNPYSEIRNAVKSQDPENRIFQMHQNRMAAKKQGAEIRNGIPLASIPETAPAVTNPALNTFTPLTDEEAEIVAQLDSMSDEGIRAEAQRLNLPVDPAAMVEQQIYNMVRSRKIADLRANNNQISAQQETPIITPVSGENSISRETLLPPQEQIETPSAPAVVASGNEIPDTSVNIPGSPSPIDTAQAEINTQAIQEAQTRADEEAEALASEIESEIRTLAEEEEIAREAESDAVKTPSVSNPLLYTAEDDIDIPSPETLDADTLKMLFGKPQTTAETEKISAMKKAESDFNAIQERKAKLKNTALDEKQRVTISEIDPSKISDNKIRQSVKLAQRVFNSLGMGKVITVETNKEKTFYGVTIRRNNAEKNHTFLNMTDIKNDPALLFREAMHELIHDLVKNNAEAYKKLRDKIIPALKGESWFESKLKKYAENRGYDLENSEHMAICEEEFICDTIADLMQTEMFWQTLAEEDLPLAEKILEAMKDFLAKVKKSFGKIPDQASGEFLRQLKHDIELAQEFITEASGKSKKDLLSAVMPEETTQVNTQVTSAENAQTTGELFESSEKRKSQNEVPKKGTDKEILEVAPSDQTEQTTEKTSVPSTPTEPQAKETVEQVGEQVETAATPPKNEVNSNLKEELRTLILADEVALSKNIKMKRIAKKYNLDEKTIQEMTEAEIVKIIGEINSEQLSDLKKFEELVKIYNKQPRLSLRTSTSMRNQAYSTPAPLAWILQKRIGIEQADSVYEPTAGTGMLVSIADHRNTAVNELNDLRADTLREQNFNEVTQNDALTYSPQGEFSHIIMNPPFGNAETKKINGFTLSKLDHQIAAQALESLSDDGKAAIIIGANNENRTSNKPTAGDWTFLNYLYNNFNVADNFVIDGTLYKNQGASYPVRVITLDGRKNVKNIEKLAPTDIEKIDSWDKVYNKLKGEIYVNKESSAVQRSDSDQRNNMGSSGEHGKTSENRTGVSGMSQTDVSDQNTGNERNIGSRSARGTGDIESRQLSVERSGRELPGVVQRSKSEQSVSVRGTGSRELFSDTGVLSEKQESAERTGNTGRGRSGGDQSERAVQRDVSRPGRVEKIKKGKQVSNLHTVYSPASKATPLETVTPNYMADGLIAALNRLQDKYGSVDEFVRQELDYSSQDEMFAGLAAEQIDGVALAIDSIKNNTGFIIGDQTGVGKGRQAAALQRWAILNGKIPVFFTKKPVLLSDMYGDGKDIGTTFNPLIIGSSSEANIADKKTGEILVKATKSDTAGKKLQQLIDNDGTFDCLWTTYSQISQSKDTVRKLIEKLVNTGKALIIMDEAHEAAGDSKAGYFFRGGETKAKTNKNGEKKEGEKFDGILNKSDVVYLSATFAKRPDNMPLYFRTSISKAVDDVAKLPQIMSDGGEALQQWISQGLAADGQMKRSERDFTGVVFDPVEYTPPNISEVKKQYDRVAEALRDMIAYSNLVNKTINERLSYGKANTQEDTATKNSTFASNTHNFISSLLLALKLDAVADRVADSVKKGEKPVIALIETKGSFLEEYISDNNLKIGDRANINFTDILISAVNRMYKYHEKDASGEVERGAFTPEELGLADIHNDVINKINSLGINLPASPIDYLRNKLEQKGIKTSEITGRNSSIDYSDKFPTIAKRSKSDKDPNTQIRLFNSGEVDSIILNAAGSTGISLHADKRFKDQKPRKMFMIQPSLDIAVVMQMFGRVLRSGQVVKPSYEIFSLALPAEKRPTMVLAKKMRSLNANTSANAKGNIEFGADVLNKYGDIIAGEYLSSHGDIAKQTNINLEYDESGNVKSIEDGLMRKFLGKVAILPNNIQDKIYKEITESYNEYVDQLKAIGEYDLELESHDDWDVKTDETDEVVSGDNESIFTSPVIRKGVSIKLMRNIPSMDFVKKEIKDAFGDKSKTEVIAEIEKQVDPIRKAIDKINDSVWEGKDEKFIAERKNMNNTRLEQFLSWVKNNLNRTLSITIGEDVYYGVVSNIKISKDIDPKNPAMNAFKVRFTVGDNVTHLTYNYRQIAGGKPFVTGTFMSFSDIFTGEKQETREDRQIFTGNLLKAYELIGDKGSGKVVTYMTSDGNRETGILMAKKWKVGEMSRDPRNELDTPETAFDELEHSGKISTADGNLSIVKRMYSNGSYFLTATKKRSEGGKYYLDERITDITGDFYSQGQFMRVSNINQSEVKKLIDYLYEKTKLRKVNSNGAAFSMVGDVENDDRKYYQIPWKEGLHRAVTDKSVREPVFVSETPDVFKNIGFTALPMLMNVRHLRLNYYNKADFEQMFGKMRQGEHTHNLRDKLEDLPKALQHPLAIVVNQTPNATPGSVVAITDMNINGKKVVVPVLIENVKSVDGDRIDSHLVLTVYDSNNWMEQFLAPAIKAEKNGIGIFYFDANKAGRYGAYSNKIGTIPTGFVHNIAEAGINVKPQTETFQFKKYFGDWQDHPKKASKVVDDEGKPLIVYNGGKSEISIFDIEQTGKSNEFAKVGFWFSDEKSLADSFAKNWYNQTWNGKEYVPGDVYAVYLNIRNPKIYESRKSDKYKIDKLDKENNSLNREVIELNRKYQFGIVSYEENTTYNIAMRNGFSNQELDEDTKKYYQEKFPQAIKDGEKVRKLKQKINANINEIKRERLSDAYEQFKLDVYEASGQSANDYGRSLKDPQGAKKFRDKLKAQGYDGIIIKGTDYDSSLTDTKLPVNQYVVFDSTQIKSATDNIGTFDGTNPDIRFSLPSDLGDTSLSPIDYRRSIDPLFDFVMEYTDSGIINPGMEHEGEDFSGSFISSEFVAYSEKKPQGKKQSDAQYQQYLAKRERALNTAEGTPLDDIAAAYVRKFGGNEKDIAERILDTLRHLTKRELISDRAEAKREVLELEREQRKEDAEEWSKMKDAELTKQVNELFESDNPPNVDKRWVQMHRQIYPKLYQTVFPNAENIPDIPSKREMAIINEALNNGKITDAAKIAEPYLTDKNLKVKGEADETEHNYMIDIVRKWFPIIKKLDHYFKDSNGKEDIGLFRRILSSPMWIAKHFKNSPAVKAIYQASQDLFDDRAKISKYLNAGLIDRLDKLKKENEAEYKKLNEYLLKCDRDQTGAGTVKGDKDSLLWLALDKDGISIGSFKTEEEAWTELFRNERDTAIKNGMSEAAADSLLAFRDAMRRTYLFRIDTSLRTLRQAGLIDANSTSFIIENVKDFFPDVDITGKIDLFELMREMGQRSGYYVPRIRHGKYMLRAIKAGKPTILKGFDTKVGRAGEIRKLKKEGYKVESFVSNAPDQDMMGQINPAALMDIINQATIRANAKMKNDLTFEEVTYTKKDGTKEQHLVLSPDAKLNTQTTTLLKTMGGMFIDGAWHFVKTDATILENLQEVLKGQALTEAKTQMLMQSAIGASLVDMIRENSSGSSKIQRRTAKGDDVIRGYEEDMLKVSALYLNGVAGATARNIMAKKMYAAFGGMCFDREKYITDLIPEGLEEGTEEYNRARLNATAEYYKEVKRLALNSSTQPELTKYMDKYIKDMLRNTTGLERSLGLLKAVSAVWMLTKPSSALNNLTGGISTNPAVIHGKTQCGIGYAAKQVAIGAKLYNQYFNWNKYGKGTNLSQQNKELFDIIHGNGWDGAELTKSATDAGLTFLGKRWREVSDKLLFMFGHAEQTNRAAAIYAAVQALAKQRGIDFSSLSKTEKYNLVKEAKEISDFGNGVYNKGNKLSIARGGGWGAVADSALLFKTYTVNYVNMIYDMLKEGNIRGAMYTMTITALAGGMKISVLGTVLATLAGIGFADDGEEKDEAFYRMLAENFGQGFSNVVKYGLPSLLKINMSGTYQDEFTDLIHDGFWDGNVNVAELPAFAIYRNLSNFFEYAGTGQGIKAVEQILPSWGANAARSIREEIDGVTDSAGRKRKDVHDKYIEPDGYDTALRALGFNPIDISEKTDRVWSEKKVREKFSEMRKDITADYRDIMSEGKPSNDELVDISKRIEEYNAKARRSPRNIPFIDGTMLDNALKDKDNKFFKADLGEKDRKRIEKKAKGKIVIRNGKLVRE